MKVAFVGRLQGPEDGMECQRSLGLQVAGCLSPVDRFRLGSVVDRVGFQVRDSLSGELVLAANPGAPLALGPSTVRRTTGLGLSQ